MQITAGSTRDKIYGYDKWKQGDLCVVSSAILECICFWVFLCHRILRSTLFEATTVVGMAPIYYAYNALLCILQVLHIFWFYTIIHMAKSFIISGKVVLFTVIISTSAKRS